MKRLFDLILSNYSEEDYYMKKKAEYTVVFLLMTLSVMIAIIILEHIIIGLNLSKIIFTGIFFSLFICFIPLIKYRKLELAVNLLIISSTIRILMIYFYPTPFQFYAMVFLTVLTIAVIHIKKYQIYCVYIINTIFIVYKVFVFHNMVISNLIHERAYTESIYATIIFLVFLFMVHFIIEIIYGEITHSHQLKIYANTDLLTGLHNRRSAELNFEQMMAKEDKLCVILLDIDYFKNINDTYGHKTGDRVLIKFANLLKEIIKENNRIFRWGGEEFLILLPGYKLKDAEKNAEYIRQQIENSKFFAKKKLTSSLGVCELRENETIEEVINRADIAMYYSKRTGRNNVTAR